MAIEGDDTPASEPMTSTDGLGAGGSSVPISEPTPSEEGHARWQDWPDNRLIHIQDEIHELRAEATGVLATTCEVAIEMIDLVLNTRYYASRLRAESDARVAKAVREDRVAVARFLRAAVDENTEPTSVHARTEALVLRQMARMVEQGHHAR